MGSHGVPDALAEVEPRAFRAAVESAGHSIYWTDRAGTIEYVNPAFEEQTGYDAAEVVGSNANVLQSGVHDDRFYEDLWDTILSGDVWTGEIVNARKDGTRYVAQQTISPVTGDDGDIVGFVAVNEDVTDLHAAQERAERERDRFAALFDAVPVPLVLTSFAGDGPEVERANEAFVDTFGVSASRLRGAALDDLIVPDGDEDSADAVNANIRRGESVRRQVEREVADGERRTFLLTATPLDPDGGESLNAYVDVTERERASAELARKNARLERFADVVSHDLRSPLNVAMGYAELLDGDDERVDAIRTAHDRMAELVDSLLVLAKEGKGVETIETVDLAARAEASWETVDARDATLRVPATNHVRADRSRLGQVFANLYRNAVEHAGRDATVTVSDLPSGFAVADDGPGIPVEERERVFESGYTTTADGTGFGLAIVAEIADAHGWTVSIGESDSGGARFEFTDVGVVERADETESGQR
ncbi:sensor histidine kinase [Salarchaeum japonicum]|uniref:histidine kinase n=1 Tax=Salarchaeum japonicum TaxID=555573 RepID=A0AAV3T0J0_9EURY|nr:PAS domain-containing sensor histidine kinase [Salarchaeum japonicum]